MVESRGEAGTPTPNSRPKKVLIAQLNSIRSYRVRFFELLEERRPRTWEFQVVHDCDPQRGRRLFPVYLDPATFKFPILPVRTFFLWGVDSYLMWQTFFLKASQYDMVITDTLLSNLSYVGVTLWQLLGVKRGYWGHVVNRHVPDVGGRSLRAFAQRLKLRLYKAADMFFAYTSSEYEKLLSFGYPPQKIVVLHNTIDITSERNTHQELVSKRDAIRQRENLIGKEVIIYLGRLSRRTNMEILFDALPTLKTVRPTACVVFAGRGTWEERILQLVNDLGKETVRYYPDGGEGRLSSELLTAADLYCLPDSAGLGAIRAHCYDLPVVYFGHKFHSPEVEYLTSANSTRLSDSITPAEFAQKLSQALDYWKDPSKRAQIFPSIAHLTIENMVDNFIEGVNRALGV